MRELIAERRLRSEINSDRVIQTIAEIAFAKKAEKTKDRLKALEMLAKHLSLFDKDEFQPPMLVQQVVSSEVVTDIPDSDKQLIDEMSPIERERLRKALERRIIEGQVDDVDNLPSEAADGKP